MNYIVSRVLNLSLLLTFIVLIGISCANEEPKISYDVTKSLEPHEVNVQGAEILNPTGFVVTDFALMIEESKQDSSKFRFFDINNYQFLTSFGKDGNGPDEFSRIIQPYISTTQKDRIQIFDWSNKRLDIYDVNGNGHEISYSKSIEYTLPPQLMLSQASAFINDSTIVTSSGLVNGLLAFTNINNDESTYFNPLNYDLSNFNAREKRFLFISDIAINNEEKLIAIAPRFIPHLYIINFEGEQIAKHVISEAFDLNNLKDIGNKKGIFYGVAATNEHVFAAYVGKSLNEMDVLIDSKDDADIKFTYLYKFNWEGEFLNSYQLLGGSYRSFSIDEANKKIYSQDLLTSKIVYFEMD